MLAWKSDGRNRTSMPGEGHEDPTEAQIRWQVFQAIAYGAKGLLYFAFHPFGVGLPGGLVRCEPKHAVGPCPNALEPTHHYWQAQRINSAVLAIAPVLMRATVLDIADLRYQTVPNPRPVLAAMADGCGLLDISRGEWTVSCFALAPDAAAGAEAGPAATATKALMIANFEHAYTQCRRSSGRARRHCRTRASTSLCTRSTSGPGWLGRWRTMSQICQASSCTWMRARRGCSSSSRSRSCNARARVVTSVSQV